MSRASWSKLGGGRLRRDCPELELAHELGWDQEKARGVLHAEAGLRGGAAACGAARSAAAGAQREVLRLSGVVHVVGGPDVLHSRVLAARNAHGQPRRCPQVTKGSAHPLAATPTSPSSAATATVSSTACAAPRSTSCARCPASSRRGAPRH